MARDNRTAKGNFLENAWYPIAWDADLGSELLGRTIITKPIVLFRDDEGVIHALGGRCPHRFAPLARGKRVEQGIECPYHGLIFGSDGRCAVNPHDDIVPKTGVPVYPVYLRYGLIWIWTGDNDRADASLIPDFPFLEDPTFEYTCGTIYGAGHYELYSDNILDLSHAAYLHTGLNASAFLIGQRKFEQDGNRIWTRIFHPNDYASDVTSIICDVVDKKQDHWVDVRWDPPAAMTVTGLVADPGQPKDVAIQSPSLHIFTPESDEATFYFWAAAWPRRNDPVFADQVRAGFIHAFENEDKPMIKAQYELMGGDTFWDLQPVLLRGDAGGVKARRTLARLIAHEREQDNSPAS